MNCNGLGIGNWVGSESFRILVQDESRTLTLWTCAQLVLSQAVAELQQTVGVRVKVAMPQGGDQTWPNCPGVLGVLYDIRSIRRVSLLQLRRVHSDLAPSHPFPLYRQGSIHTLTLGPLRRQGFSGEGAVCSSAVRSDPSTEQNRKKDVGLSE